jgi:hypothetical protein
MKKYKVIKKLDFGTGSLIDKAGNTVTFQSFAPKVGDIIELGELKTKIIWSSAPMTGYDYNVNTDGQTPSKAFINSTDVEEVAQSTPITKESSISNQKSNVLFISLVVVSIIIISIVAYKYCKK